MSGLKKIFFRRRFSLRLLAILFLSLPFPLLSSCFFPEDEYRRPLPLSSKVLEARRASPDYIQYLERQSMLSQAADLSNIVSGSGLNWRHPASEPMPEGLLAQGDVWLHINPQSVRASARNTPLRQMNSPVFWDILRRVGINGLYVAPAGSSGDIWDSRHGLESAWSGDVIQYTFPAGIGSEGDYLEMFRRAAEQNVLLGGDILPLAGGLGPDFFLATRNVRDYPGLYCMFEAPRHIWPRLPKKYSEEEEGWGVTPLTDKETRFLAGGGFIPESMRQDSLPYASESGWAVTDEILGLDGNLRRWIYRYVGNYRRPLLNLYDPSNLARKVLSGSLVYQAGILGNSLAGLQVAPLIGFEAENGLPADLADEANYAAAFGLAEDLARQSRSYGGWFWLKDSLPLPVLRSAMRRGADLVMDGVFSPAAEHALLSGRKDLLEFMLDEALREGIDFRRLLHASSGPYGVDYTLPQLRYMAAEDEEERNRRAAVLLRETLGQAESGALAGAEEAGQSAFEDSRLYTTPLGLAVLALESRPRNPARIGLEEESRRGHMLLLFFKAMLPGVFMLSGQDLAGSLPLPPQTLRRKSPGPLPAQGPPPASSFSEGELRPLESYQAAAGAEAPPPGDSPAGPASSVAVTAWARRLAPMGSYALTVGAESAMPGGTGIPAARSAYGPFDAQSLNPASALNEIARILRLRRELSVAGGTLVGRLESRGAGVLALVIRLPSESRFSSPDGFSAYALLLSNFGRAESRESIDLAALPDTVAVAESAGVNMLYGEGVEVYRHGEKILLVLPPWSGALLLLEKDAPEAPAR
ncbi:MAG: hypothetical protein LBQ63_08095 [Deltaproteobacteria bacterium]|jgi:trehalose synthase|nr:hypothetical protein [Deltaproteobacteria bacterium]